MINYAKASLYHWRKSDKYEIVNEQRGQWLISHVYAILGKSDEALSYAKKLLEITEEKKRTKSLKTRKKPSKTIKKT